MAKTGGSSGWIWIVAGVVVLVGLCCVGTAGVGFFAYQQQREAEARAIEEIARYEQIEAEERARAEALAAEQRMEQEQVFAPPPSLALSPARSSDRAARRIRATVTSSLGSSGVAIGDTCEFDVQVLDSAQEPAGYWCRALVQCGTMRLYGTDVPQPNGYFPCETYRSPRGVAGEDLDTSANGGDGAFQIDTRAGRFVVLDDSLSMVGGAFRVEAVVTEVR